MHKITHTHSHTYTFTGIDIRFVVIHVSCNPSDQKVAREEVLLSSSAINMFATKCEGKMGPEA